MDDHTLFGGGAGAQGENARLAHWLQQVLQVSSQEEVDAVMHDENDASLELVLHSDYHVSFYQQLPDFVMALLSQDAQVLVHYAPLLYHLAGCRECHSTYLELYDALRAAVQPQETRPLLGQGTRTLAATPQRMLGHLCQSFISQAEAALRQARHEHTDNDAFARSLLQLALHLSAHIVQSGVRRQALQDLVRVATLFAGPTAPKQADSDTYAYTPVLAGAGGLRRGKVVRRSDVVVPGSAREQFAIDIQSRSLEGRIVQVGRTLELHLQDLAASLRGRYVSISVLLGSLIEPVSWIGGNPRAIHSATPVDETGALVTPLGQTDLHMGNAEERNLLEAIFMLLEVHAA